MLTVVAEDGARREGVSLLDDIVREGARRMLAAALEAEVDAAELADERDDRGRRLVVRNGHAQPRQVMTAAGAVEVTAPRVNDKRVDGETGQRKRFQSVILPPWCRKSPKVAEVLPLLYLHGLSTGDFVPALESFLGSAAGLSSATITRLSKQWVDDYHAFCARDLSQVDYVYVWADGVHINVRLDEDKLCLLVIVGVRADGTKELVALADGYRESTGSWADLLRDCARRGMRAPMLAVGDGALGFWAGLREVFPDTRHQRDWVHKVANVLAAMPKSAHPGAKAALAEVYNAEDKRHARTAAKRFADVYGAKFPKAVKKVVDDLDELLAFYDFPADHWIHLRTSNPIESTFATLRHRTRVTKGPGSRAAGLAMAFKLIESAQQRWRAVNAPHLVALVRAGARFQDGVLVERGEVQAA
ncbi:IS256 family transposase [Micromonospora kangleipakensis]|uniref:IS256 family transposase n=1 Tax=Micromonospora kangleipakensis TaxID=1077942 RepID=UPI001028D183|nr:IS256 family transposase [Micromonospora kangleipakensis]